MKILILQHVPFEGPAAIKAWAEQRDHQLLHHDCSNGGDFPALDNIDMVIVMGGPMSANDPLTWLDTEVDYLQNAMRSGKMVIGICLGAQLMAKALGGNVRGNSSREIGWFPVTATQIANNWVNDALPNGFTPLHWHSDTFDLPSNASLLFRSEACENQAFLVGSNIVGLQFHLEFDRTTAQRVADACAAELHQGGKFVQTKSAILDNTQWFKVANGLVFKLLDAAEKQLKENQVDKPPYQKWTR